MKLGWWVEQLYSVDLAELVEAMEGRGVEIELKRARLIGKVVGFGKVGLGLVQEQRQQDLHCKEVWE